MQSGQTILIEGPQRVSDLSYKQIETNGKLKEMEQGISVSNFSREKNAVRIQQEFLQIKEITETEAHRHNFVPIDENVRQTNKHKEAYPFTHNLVQLQSGEFFSASFIDSVLADNQFIATQGPLSNTVNQFWQCVIEQNVSIIIMLGEFQEGKKAKTFQYFPTSSKNIMEFQSFKLELVSEEQPFNNLFVRKIALKQQKQQKEIFHLQCRSFPEFGKADLLTEFSTILYVIQTMKKNIEDFPGVPILVHCNYGVGDTGVILSIFNCIQAMEAMIEKQQARKLKKGEGLPRISVFGVVRRLREQKFQIVQTTEHYEFIYDFVDKAIKNIAENQPLNQMPGHKQSKTKFTISGKFDTNQHVSKCFNCMSKPFNPNVIIKCNHKFCDDCIIESFKVLLSQQAKPKAQETGGFTCPICGKSTCGEEWKIGKNECIFKCPICGKDTHIEDPKFANTFQSIWSQSNVGRQ